MQSLALPVLIGALQFRLEAGTARWCKTELGSD